MPLNLRSISAKAKDPTPWRFSNAVLYEVCRTHPFHRETEVVLAKVLLIGRAYAAAIERRKPDETKSSDDFHVHRVSPLIMKSSIDRWIKHAKGQKPGTPEALRIMIEIHGRTTDLFSAISGLEKRSLAAKYLHFHVPELFFIYDSRAVMRTLIYKRTHNGDPDPKTSEFGIHDCMGRVRTWDFDAVIGVGGLSAKPRSMARKVNWIGIGPQRGRWYKRGPVVTFARFIFYDSETVNAPKFDKMAPLLAKRIYSKNVRVVMNGLSTREQMEVDKVLALAKRAPASILAKTSKKSLKGC